MKQAITDSELMRKYMNMVNENIEMVEKGKLEEKYHIRLINEEEYSKIFFNETKHYPEFLTILFRNISEKVYPLIKEFNNSFIHGNEAYYEKYVEYDCEYFTNIKLKFSLQRDNNINNNSLYEGQYNPDVTEFKNGKLIAPYIDIGYPVNESGETIWIKIFTVLNHELTHVYDDWVCRTQNKKRWVTLNDGDYIFMGQNMNKGKENPLKWMALLVYFNNKSEQRAFLAQTVTELSANKCDISNYKYKAKETVSYLNYQKTYVNFVKVLSECDNNLLYDINQEVSKIPNTTIPRMKQKQFNPQEYKNKLLKWGEEIYYTFMKKYGSVVWYYVYERNPVSTFKKPWAIDID